MSERILKALMQLFAIVANVGEDNPLGREFVRFFLKQQLNQELVNKYLAVFDQYVEEQTKRRNGTKIRKRTSVNSVKVLVICTQINKELTQKQKIFVLIKLLEFVYLDKNVVEQAIEFADTVADTFNISKKEYQKCKSFIESEVDQVIDSEDILLVSSNPPEEGTNKKHISAPGFEGKLRILFVKSVRMLFVKYLGNSELQLNGQLIIPYKIYILNQGSALRGSKLSTIYYSDIISKFLSDKNEELTTFTAENVTYKFKNGNVGLHELSFQEESGGLIGIMGASGAGKSTLLNVLNGNYKPTTGSVKINGYDINNSDNKEVIEGIIGYVSQDDLLIEELTVFQNLFFNAKLCFGNLSETQLIRLVIKVLNALGLYETKDLKVGSPMDKTISGGQRKRVNIALELIREPAVLFVDEPTSGLSSRDSENIMDLLKELSLRGKLIFVVIHQPSSDIFKMFDKLLILDTGGYLIYNGNPVDAIIYFKTIANQANRSESECVECGNVNPEQIFNIIESKVIDEYGNQTDSRKTVPQEWQEHYHEENKEKQLPPIKNQEAPTITFKIPNLWKQFKVFLKRDILSKLTNKQYLLINFLEAPILAFILSYIVKYKNADEALGGSYVFRENENITAYIFMSVIVALFMGLTVAAEEIIRDQKILKREQFLNLSKGSYLFSKISIMFMVSAIQTLSFVLVGNTILEIQGMYFEYWLILFSTSCFANMLGLNISSAFNSAVTIYILIPFLVIPQLILSGVIVKFEKLNPSITIQNKVPWSGDIMVSKWAFEALAVNQFKNNAYNKNFYYIDKDLKQVGFKKNFWLSRMREKVNFVERNIDKAEKIEELKDAFTLLKHEINKTLLEVNEITFKSLDQLSLESATVESLQEVKTYLAKLNDYYIDVYNQLNDTKDQVVSSMNESEKEREEFIQLKNDYTNESLNDLVTNKNDLNKIIEWDNQLIQHSNPIYKDPEGFRAHFFAPSKLLFGTKITTYSANLLVIWMFSIVLAITLYYDLLKHLLNYIEKKFNSISRMIGKKKTS
jgi:ABC-type multidrug transport system ATPase subunit